MSEYNPGDILTISSSASKGACYTVTKTNGHRTTLRGAKGAHRVLVMTGFDRLGVGYSIHEDDGEDNRGRPCEVVGHEASPTGQLARVSVEPPPLPSGWEVARRLLVGALGLPDDTVWDHCIREVERLRSINESPVFTARPVAPIAIASLMLCESAPDLAEWVIDREVGRASYGDRHAADTVALMRLYLDALKVRGATQ